MESASSAFRRLLELIPDSSALTRIDLDESHTNYFNGNSGRRMILEQSTNSKVRLRYENRIRIYFIESSDENFKQLLQEWISRTFPTIERDQEEGTLGEDITFATRRSTRNARRRTVGEVFGSEFTQGLPVRRQRIRGQSMDRIRDMEDDRRMLLEDDDELSYDRNMEEPSPLTLNEAMRMVVDLQPVPFSSIEKHPDMKRLAKTFIDKCAKECTLYYCWSCKEKWFLDSARGECQTCKDHPGKFVSLNDMDPLNPPRSILGDLDPVEGRREYKYLMDNYRLTNVEENLIALNQVVMQAFRLKGGAAAFKGNVISFVQDIQDICNVLPRVPSSLQVLVVRCARDGDNDVSSYIDFKVRRDYVYRWLVFLKKWSPAYRHIVISEENLLSLPEDGSIYDQLPSRLVQEVEHAENQNVGPEEGPEGNEEADSVQYTGSESRVETTQSEMEAVEDMILNWPSRRSEPNDEYATTYLYAASFPTLFPFGAGDVHSRLHRHSRVSLHDANKHYLRYWDNESKRFPFAEHARFLHFAQDIDERHRIQSQASIFLKHNEGDANMTLQELRQLRGTGHWNDLMNRMCRYGGGILGSAASFVKAKKQLLALIETKKSPTSWFTLTLPTWLWEEFEKLAGDNVPGSDEEWRVWFNKNPHLVNEFFLRRVNAFIETFFGKDSGLTREWVWYRVEFQKRGTIHVHGMLRLETDPGLSELGTVVIKGHKSWHLLRLIQSRYNNHIPEAVLSMFDEILENVYPQDIICESTLDRLVVGRLVDQSSFFDDDYIERLFQNYREGVNAEAKIIAFSDFLCSSVNHSNPLPSDIGSDERNEYVREEHLCHPISKVQSLLKDHEYDLNADAVKENINSILNQHQRHRHNMGYCWRDGRCRFGFPRKLQENTSIVVKDILYKRGEKQGTVKNTVVEVMNKTNDRWLNNHIRLGTGTFASNMDFNILIDSYGIVSYIAKYANKTESPTRALHLIMEEAIRISNDNSATENSKSVIRRTFNQITGRRDKSIMEICHLISSSSYIICDHKFSLINIFGDSTRVDLSDGEASLVSKKLYALYAKRLEEASWSNRAMLTNHTVELKSMNLIEFVSKYYAKSGKIFKVSVVEKPIVTTFSPEVSHLSDPIHSEYYKYCLMALIKYIPWKDSIPSLYGSQNPFPSNLNDMIVEDRESAIAAFNTHFRDETKITFYKDDPFHRQVNQLRHDPDLSPLTHESTFSMEGEDEFDEAIRHLGTHLNRNTDNEEDNVDWDQTHDYSTLENVYTEEDLNVERIKNIRSTLGDNVNNNEGDRNVIHLADLPLTDLGSRQQRSVIETFLKIMGLWKDENGNFLPPQRQGEMGHVLLVPGPAGTGKSFIIDCLITEISERYMEKMGLADNSSFKVMICAPTGKAALQVGGHTFQSSHGLSVPVDELEDGKNEYQDGPALKRLQERLKKILALILDEFSMNSSVQFYWISRRMQEGTKNFQVPFGGIPVIIFGDPGQLPPVSGFALWCGSTNKRRLKPLASQGHALYKNIKNVLQLTEVRRQTGLFRDILLRLRVGAVTLEDWRYLNDTCSLVNMNEERKMEFMGSNVSHILATNEGCNKTNNAKLTTTNKPIALVEAEHDSPESKGKKGSHFRNLQSKLFLSVNTRVILLWNICVDAGLVNGSIGVVKDIVYGEGVRPPALPIFAIVEFEDYVGPAFFSEEERRQWVPLVPESYEVHTRSDRVEFRKTFPVERAWALTAWKSQGMTCHGKVMVELSPKEKSPGLSYVQLSRVTTVENLCIHPPVEFERLSTDISKSAALQERLREDDRLNERWVETKSWYGITD